MHCTPTAFVLARLNAGRSIAASIAMMAITTSSSIKVKPRARGIVSFELKMVFMAVDWRGSIYPHPEKLSWPVKIEGD